MTELDVAFREFDDANPQVYAELVRLARRWKQRRGDRVVGIRMLWEVMRWNLSIKVESADAFKLNDHHPPFYARKIMRHERDLEGMFNIRGRAELCDCSACCQRQLTLAA